jgi:hypothetical protein
VKEAIDVQKKAIELLEKEAADVQKKAIELTEEKSLKQEMTITLKRYEASLAPSDKPPVPAEGKSKKPATPKAR